jgi:hypothetical protein
LESIPLGSLNVYKLGLCFLRKNIYIYLSVQLFLNCLCNLQNNQILCEIDCVKLFCNIPEIYAANRNFWHNYILPVLTVSSSPFKWTVAWEHGGI